MVCCFESVTFGYYNILDKVYRELFNLHEEKKDFVDVTIDYTK